MVERYLSGKSPDELYALCRAEGALPPGDAGRARFGALFDGVFEMAGRLKGELDDAPLEPQHIHVEAGPLTISGGLRHCGPRGVVHYRYGRLRGVDCLELWLAHLLTLAAAPKGNGARSVFLGRTPNDTLEFTVPSQVKQILSAYSKLWLMGATTPVPFFPEASYAYAEKVLNEDPSDGAVRARGLNAAQGKYHGDAYSRPNRHEQVLWAGQNPVSSVVSDQPSPFEMLALEVFRPLFEVAP